MLLLEPSLRSAVGGNFPSTARSEGAAATEIIHGWAARVFLKTKIAGVQVNSNKAVFLLSDKGQSVSEERTNTARLTPLHYIMQSRI